MCEISKVCVRIQTRASNLIDGLITSLFLFVFMQSCKILRVCVRNILVICLCSCVDNFQFSTIVVRTFFQVLTPLQTCWRVKTLFYAGIRLN